jgi:cell filamentation protein
MTPSGMPSGLSDTGMLGLPVGVTTTGNGGCLICTIIFLMDWNRYSALPPDEQEPDAEEGVFKNKLGIKTREMIEAAERTCLEEAAMSVFKRSDFLEQICTEMIKELHFLIFGSLYHWAGEYRSVELHLPHTDLYFCPSMYIVESLKRFDNDLRNYLIPNSHVEFVVEASKHHAELVIIHPFRDGNGRTARLFTDYMALQAGFKPFDWQVLLKEREKYYKSIQTAYSDRNYEPLSFLFLAALNS